jgi:hypothetical protein
MQINIGMVAYWEKYGWQPFCPEPIDQHEFECH